jgi:hypothetical protein
LAIPSWLNYDGEFGPPQSEHAPSSKGGREATPALAALSHLWSDPGPRQAEDERMAFEDLKAEIALLFSQMENQPEDRHELYLQIREKLNEMRAFGLPLPDDLVRLEKELEAEFRAEERPAKKR